MNNVFFNAMIELREVIKPFFEHDSVFVAVFQIYGQQVAVDHGIVFIKGSLKADHTHL